MNILLHNVRVQTYQFDFRLPSSLLSVTFAQDLLGYTNIPSSFDLLVTVCLDSQRSFSTKLAFAVTSHLSDPFLVLFGSDFRDACERMGVASFASSFSPLPSSPSANTPDGIHPGLNPMHGGAQSDLHVLPSRFSLPPVWPSSPVTTFRASGTTTGVPMSPMFSASPTFSVDNVPSSSTVYHSSVPKSGYELYKDMFSCRFTSGVRTSPFLSNINALKHVASLHGLNTCYFHDVKMSSIAILHHLLVGDCFKKHTDTCKMFANGFESLKSVGESLAEIIVLPRNSGLRVYVVNSTMLFAHSFGLKLIYQ
ncbi:hypothetical protein C8R42DRAFT_670962 [Lentinula raphanica]|nr:hypothetical protein C8R42DRAFT_670962 [Lentinula raphanica]